MWIRGRAVAAAFVGGLIALVLTIPVSVLPHGGGAQGAGLPDDATTTARATADAEPLHEDSRTVLVRERADAIARAHVRTPTTPIARAHLGADPTTPSIIECRFRLSDLGGTTPKFNCVLDSGKELRVKYGPGAEIPGEAAATRLLTALGFVADTVTLVERLRCYGCPNEPFVTTKVVEATGAQQLYERVADDDDYEDFEWVAVEQKFAARPIETENQKGWALRARRGRSVEGWCAAGVWMRCVCWLPRSLGQQGREPAAGVSVEDMARGDGVPRAVPRLAFGPRKSGSRGMGAVEGLGGSLRVQAIDEGFASWRRNLRVSSRLGTRAQVPGHAAS